jgi:hypothetical protein
LGHTSLLATASVTVTTRLGEKMTMEQGYYFLQANNNFQRNVIYNTVRYHF